MPLAASERCDGAVRALTPEISRTPWEIFRGAPFAVAVTMNAAWRARLGQRRRRHVPFAAHDPMADVEGRRGSAFDTLTSTRNDG